VCYLAPNAYHLQLVILHSADVLSTTLLQSSLHNELYIYVAVILLRLNYFQFCVKSCLCLRYLAPSSVLVTLLLSPTAALTLPTSARKAPSQTNLMVFLGRVQVDHRDKSTDIVWRFWVRDGKGLSETS
jgi:hypothetical protein